MHRIVSQLEVIRRRARALLVAQRFCVLLAILTTSLILIALGDYLLRFPASLRFVFELIAAGVAAGLLWSYLRPAMVFYPSLTDIALRLEGWRPQLKGHLASGVEFTMTGEDQKSGMAARAVRDMEQRAGREHMGRIVNPKRAFIDGFLALIVIAVIVSAGWYVPEHTTIAAQRVLLPFGSAEWPKRTGIESGLDFEHFPLGQAFPLQATVTKGLYPEMRVYANYRLVRDGQPGRWEEVILTHQRDQMFERFIEPEADEIEIYFETDDDRTETRRIRLIEPPRILSAWLHVEPPTYAAKVLETHEFDLGPGTDDRSTAAAGVLVGSSIHLTFTFNRELPVPQNRDEWLERLGWVESTGLAEITFESGGSVESSAIWIAYGTLRTTEEWHPQPVDEFGIGTREEPYYRIRIVEDSPPNISIIEPSADETVLPTAEINIIAEGRDDVALGTLRMVAEVQTAPSSTSETTETGPVTTLATQESATPLDQISAMLDIASLDAQPGAVVEITAVVSDTFDLDGRTHGEVRSTPRRLRIISEADFVEQVFRDLGKMRDQAIRLVEEQARLREAIEQDVGSGHQREQARVGHRIGRQGEMIDAITSRVERNRLDAPEISALLDRAAQLLDESGGASNEAAETLAEAAQAHPDESLSSEEREKVLEQQKEVENQLSELIDLLDRGQDSWVVRRMIESLRAEQQQLANTSEELTTKTRGRETSDLNDQERRDLERLSDEQDELANKARDLLDEMRERSERVREKDPDLSDSIAEAAKTAEENGLTPSMKQAAEQLNRNQGQRASESQQSAMDALDQMLDKLEENERARAERLQRQLDSIIQALEALIEDQTSQIEELVARAGGAIDGLDEAMIHLNTNTYAVFDQAKDGGPELAPVADLIEDAAEAQEGAIESLRSQPVQHNEAQQNEERSLDRLVTARDLAQEKQDEMQEDENRRKKNKLIRAYRDLYNRELTLRDLTTPLTKGAGGLDRRQRVTARQLARTQAEIQSEAAQMLQDVKELADAVVFEASHRFIDDQAQRVVEGFRRGEVNVVTVMREQDVADRFLALALALESTPDDSEFEEEEEQGGGGGGGGGGGPKPLIPPVAQLKLLRGLQEAVYRSTRTLDEMASLAEGLHNQRLDEIGTAQQEISDLANQVIREMQQGSGPPIPDNGGRPGGSP